MTAGSAGHMTTTRGLLARFDAASGREEELENLLVSA
ncbi:MAG: hypothetical protein QOE09_97, partial [Ilumatobacteraceae bacterium]